MRSSLIDFCFCVSTPTRLASPFACEGQRGDLDAAPAGVVSEFTRKHL